MALAIVGSLVVGPAATAEPERMSAGTVVFIHEQEPPSLRGNWLDNNLLATGLVTNNIWYGGQIYDRVCDPPTTTPREQAEARQEKPADRLLQVQGVRGLE